jgi:hypothetical protein
VGDITNWVPDATLWSLKSTLDCERRQNQDQGIDKSPDKRDPRRHSEVSSIVDATDSYVKSAFCNQCKDLRQGSIIIEMRKKGKGSKRERKDIELTALQQYSQQ